MCASPACRSCTTKLRDEVASIAEDNLLTFDPYAQAAAQLRPLLSAQIADAPLHGSVTVNAPSTGSGQVLESNLATVALAITPVIDAPTTGDIS